MTRSLVQLGGQELKLDADGDTTIIANTDDTLQVSTAGSERFRVDSSGNLLVGKTSSVFNNDGIELKADDTVVVTKDGGIALYLNRKTSHGGILAFDKDGTTMGQIDSNSGNLLIRTAGNKSGLRFDTDSYTPFKNGSEVDAGVDLGYAGGRYGQLFASSNSINTSDETEKQNIETFTDTEMKVAKKVSALFKKYKWKTAVSEKGDSARTHSGIIAQEVQSAFKEEGLDASKYGLWCSDTWWEKDDTYIDDDGKEQPTTHKWRKKEEAPSGATEVTRLGIRYAELISFICAYNEQRFASIEARLTALESK